MSIKSDSFLSSLLEIAFGGFCFYFLEDALSFSLYLYFTFIKILQSRFLELIVSSLCIIIDVKEITFLGQVQLMQQNLCLVHLALFWNQDFLGLLCWGIMIKNPL